HAARTLWRRRTGRRRRRRCRTRGRRRRQRRGCRRRHGLRGCRRGRDDAADGSVVVGRPWLGGRATRVARAVPAPYHPAGGVAAARAGLVQRRFRQDLGLGHAAAHHRRIRRRRRRGRRRIGRRGRGPRRARQIAHRAGVLGSLLVPASRGLLLGLPPLVALVGIPDLLAGLALVGELLRRRGRHCELHPRRRRTVHQLDARRTDREDLG